MINTLKRQTCLKFKPVHFTAFRISGVGGEGRDTNSGLKGVSHYLPPDHQHCVPCLPYINRKVSNYEKVNNYSKKGTSTVNINSP